MSTPLSDQSKKALFWEVWQRSTPHHLLTLEYLIDAYTADFAHLPTQTIIELERLAPDSVRDQIKQQGWQIIQVRTSDLERDIESCVKRLAGQLMNKTVYLQRKKEENDSSSKGRPSVPFIGRNSSPLPTPAPCQLCGGVIAPYMQPAQFCSPCQARQHAKQQQKAVIIWAKEMMSRNDWVVIDTETTGFSKESEVIEVGIVDSQGATLLDTLVKPVLRIPFAASQVHGITNRDIVHAPSFRELWGQLSTYLQYVLLGYNISFDLRLLAQSAKRAGSPFPDPQNACLMKQYTLYQRGNDQR